MSVLGGLIYICFGYLSSMSIHVPTFRIRSVGVYLRVLDVYMCMPKYTHVYMYVKNRGSNLCETTKCVALKGLSQNIVEI